ncbi:MAG: penicillin-binding protein [Patescibacteria group bacterium]|nr:penicillin-binding protein [Patescibacteria group bacterium]
MPLRYSSRTSRVRRARKAKGFKLSLSSFSPKSIKNYLKYLFTTKEGLKKVGTVTVILLGIIIGLFGWYAKDLPTPNKINSRFAAQTTQIFDRNGKLLYEMHGDKNRILVEFDEIPENVKQATVAVEDKNFYKHVGFAPFRVVRSAVYNVFERATGANLQGGSTITQQFVKNALLSPEQTFGRKIKELILSMEIEAMYSKDDILKMYLNEIPYGSNAYGVKVAAKTYFDKELSDLTVEEAAVLASLPQAPTYYSPYGDNKDALLARKDTVLQLMADQGYISQEEADKAMEKKIAFSNNPYGSIEAPHFVMYVKQELVNKYGEQMANEGGLKVYTTLDYDLYKEATAAIKGNESRLKGYGAENAALVSTDPKTGQILSMVGSKDFFNQDIDGNVNVTTRLRQPGSSFKPFAYASLFKKENWGPGSTVYDVKTDFGGGYVPHNYNYRYNGAQSIRYSLGNSLNIPAVKALYIAGMNETLKTASDMGISTLTDKDRYGLSLVLGAGEVKPIEMAQAYGVFANGGVKHDLSWFLKIEDSDGKVLEEYKESKGKQVLDPQVAYLINNILSDTRSRSYTFGGGQYLTVPGRTVAAKTGTTNDSKDAWTAGYTPNLVTVVWGGNNDSTPMRNGSGYAVAAPIWDDYMTSVLPKFQKESFSKPSGIKTVTIDAVTGRAVTSATKSKRTDIFPSWYKTPQVNGQAQEVKIDKLSRKLATDKCPAELIETKIYSPITAEIPSNDPAYSRWNAAVQAWAKSKGYNTNMGSIPTETCDLHTDENHPSVEIMAPTEGQEINTPFTVVISASTPKGLKSITIQADGKTYTPTANGAFYEAEVTFTSLGEKTIKVIVKDNVYQTAEDTVKTNVTGGIGGGEEAFNIFNIFSFA